jgi:nucleoside-diphosphate-sugar epimerase
VIDTVGDREHRRAIDHMPYTVLVTGGAGFIGSHLVHALAARGDTVRVIDDFSSGKPANLSGTPGSGSVELIEGSILDEAALARAVAGVHTVFHQAAIPSVPRSLSAPVPSHNANATGTLLVLEAARRHGAKRVVYAGSSSAYGETPTLPKVETMSPAPLSPYAVSKLSGEHYCQVYDRALGLETVVLRYFNVFGPRQDPGSQYAAVIPRFITAALEGRAPAVFGDGSQSRDFCHIDNVVAANLLAAEVEEARGQVFNIACGQATDLNRVIALVGRALGRAVEPRYEPARTGDIKHSLADISRAERVLGYRVLVAFEDGLSRTIDWFRRQL